MLGIKTTRAPQSRLKFELLCKLLTNCPKQIGVAKYCNELAKVNRVLSFFHSGQLSLRNSSAFA